MSQTVERPTDTATHPDGRSGRSRWSSLDSTQLVWIAFVVVTLVGVVLAALSGDNFFRNGNIVSVLTLTSTLGFVAIGQTLVILGGSLDLSVPFVISLSSLVAGGIMAGQTGQRRARACSPRSPSAPSSVWPTGSSSPSSTCTASSPPSASA